MSGRHAAVILAAGGSTRLGQPKQVLRRDGEALVARVARLVAGTRPARLLVMLGGHADAVASALHGVAPVELHRVAAWRSGLAASLVQAGHALQAHDGPVLVTGVDQPALAPSHLRALLEGAARAASGCAAVLHGAAPGAPAVLAAELFAQARHLSGDRGFGALLAALPADSLALLDAPELGQDIDTEADLRTAQAAGLLDPVV